MDNLGGKDYLQLRHQLHEREHGPDGNTLFYFGTCNLNYLSICYDWLVLPIYKSRFRAKKVLTCAICGMRYLLVDNT
jgi:hypothetical protein